MTVKRNIPSNLTRALTGTTARTQRRLAAGATLMLLAAAAIGAGPARASEGGASFYLLGAGGPGAGEAPPLQGVYFDNTVYYYDGSAGGSKQFLVGGNLVAGLDATIIADFATVLWVPTTHFAGGTLALGGALPVGDANVNVSAVITRPLGHQLGVHASDSALVVGDPVGTALMGWKTGKLSVALSDEVSIPIGEYREGELANLAFHRWIDDVSLATTWHDDKSGWDLSAKAGLTFNGTNGYTQYTTGTEFHLEGAIEKRIAPTWTFGLQAYYFQQVSGDSGPGATLGPFEGRVIGVGPTAAYTFKIGKMPATLRLRGMTEFDVKNRLDGNSLWLDFTLPLSLKLPGAPHH